MLYFESINLIHDHIRPELFLPQITQIPHRAGHRLINSPCEFINLPRIVRGLFNLWCYCFANAA